MRDTTSLAVASRQASSRYLSRTGTLVTVEETALERNELRVPQDDEVGEFARFQKAGQLMSYLGLTPSEDTSGEKRRQGAITKTGSRHARRLLVEGAWH
jgi:hypothetical protein